MKRFIIAAVDEENGIGKDNKLPWHLPEDMKFFKNTTQGHVVVMGRKNWDSIPERFRPLPNRDNVVITRSLIEYEGAMTFNSIDDCLQYYDDRDIFVIGGGEIYNQMMPFVNEMYITHVEGTHNADVFFPEIKDSIWVGEEISNGEKFKIIHYKRR